MRPRTTETRPPARLPPTTVGGGQHGGTATNNSSSQRAASSTMIRDAPAYPRTVRSSPGSAMMRPPLSNSQRRADSAVIRGAAGSCRRYLMTVLNNRRSGRWLGLTSSTRACAARTAVAMPMSAAVVDFPTWRLHSIRMRGALERMRSACQGSSVSPTSVAIDNCSAQISHQHGCNSNRQAR
jgi:hypothetical protein